MMVPRSFQYGSVPREYDEKEHRRKTSYNMIISARIPAAGKPLEYATSQATQQSKSRAEKRPDVQSRAVTEPVAIPSRMPAPAQIPVMIENNQTRRTASKHRPDAISPAVAALLAMTAIPPMRPHQTRRRRTTGTRQKISIDELVNYWKSDVSLRSGTPSSPTMSVLLEGADYLGIEETPDGSASVDESCFCRARSTSTDSIPSLDADDRSSLSVRSPSTPASLRSRRSLTNLKREKVKSSSVGEDCILDHPLLKPPQLQVEDIEHAQTFEGSRRVPSTKSRSSFRSNLTTSLQALKNAAMSSLTFKSQPTQRDGPPGNSNLSDDVLWSHPFLFPRLSSEVRPSIQGTPTKAQRRYLNPMPLTFEEQEAPFQQALHAPYLVQPVKEAPVIQLQTYTRGRRRGNRSRSKSPDPSSEAGRAQLLVSGIRQREPRENANFLRVVVLEMNMRRAGKLESGRAKIWLPPRQVGERAEETIPGQVPARWIGICAT